LTVPLPRDFARHTGLHHAYDGRDEPVGRRHEGRSAIGGDLVRTALGIADELNEPLVLVLGFPAYYRRFGFQRASAFGIAPPDGIPDDAWMAVTLSSYSPALRGKVIWPPAFSGVT
jgi:putative acetyltransferase